MFDTIITNVIDVGGRYGMHTSWKPFTGELRYFMFEPDKEEAARLTGKYADRPEISVHPLALSDSAGKVKLNILSHKAQSSLLEPNPDHVWFSETRPGEGEVLESYEVEATTVDEFCAEQEINLDFIKVDTEGSELAVLMGGKRQLDESILAARIEANFDSKFENIALFPRIMDYMLERGFFLLNLDELDNGACRNSFVHNKPWGTLVHCDSIWMKREEYLFDEGAGGKKDLSIRILKCAGFCLLNGPTDLAIDLLLRARRKHEVDFNDLKGTGLLKFVDIAVQGLFEKVKRHPAQDEKVLNAVYEEIFGRQLKLLHNYYESEEINPT